MEMNIEHKTKINISHTPIILLRGILAKVEKAKFIMKGSLVLKQ